MGIVEQQRHELASFLRSRRKRLSPEAVGAHEGWGRRRTPGLRREEVAARAGVSITWYTWLEQGRRINPSRQVLSSLASALQLDPAETDHLFRLANEIPPTREIGRKAPVQQQYVRLLEQFVPLPAFIVDSVLDVHAWNQSALVLFPHFPKQEKVEQNLLRLVFKSDFREFHVEWEEEAAQLVALFRSRNTEQLASSTFRTFVDKLCTDRPEFGDFWQRQDLAQAIPATRSYRHPTLGTISLDYVTLELPSSPYFMLIYEPEPGSQLAGELLRASATGPYQQRLTHEPETVPSMAAGQEYTPRLVGCH